MSPALWFLVWVAVCLLPVRRFGFWRNVLLAFLGSVAALTCIAAAVIDPYMILILVFFKLVLTVAELWFTEEETGGKWLRIQRIARHIALFTLFAYCVAICWQVGAVARVNNAVAFNDMIVFENAPIFKNEVPDNMLRLTTMELAKSIALRNAGAYFGSVKAGSAHIALYKGRLVWVVNMVSPNLYGENVIKGFVIVDANDPEAEVEVVAETFHVGEDLLFLPPFYNGEIHGHAYWHISTASMYGRALPTVNDVGEWKYVLTVTDVDFWSFVQRPRGVYVFNEHGFEGAYSINELPWVVQYYDEDWIEYMIDCWGKHRRGKGFDVWAGGFLWIPSSTDRVEISDDTRWIIDPDLGEVVAVVAVDHIGEVQTMAGLFKITRKGIFYYDLSSLGLKSGLQAQNIIGAHLAKPASGTFEPQMPVLYTLGGRYVWFVPIYWRISGEEAASLQETVKLVGLAVVDAQSLDRFAIVMTSEGYTGASLVAEAKRRFLQGAQPETEAETTVSGVLKAKFSYVSEGNTVYILVIDDNCYKADTRTLDFRTIYRIESLKVGEQVTVVVSADGRFIRFP